jgi:RNA 2',3'-cyclic 3'-phosphodiesterase
MLPLRTFIAVDIPPSIQQAIQKKINDLRQYAGDSVRWVQVKNIHLTLKFLEAVPPSDVEELTRMLQTEADSCPAFDIAIGGLGSFPTLKRPRVLFIGVQAPAGLEALQGRIEVACSRLGYESDPRPFSPHLTIGRVRDHVSSEVLQKIRRALEETKIDSLGTVRVDSVHLYRSELKPGGPLYTELFSAPLHRRQPKNNRGIASQRP